MSEVAGGRIRRNVELLQTYTQHFPVGAIASGGVVYSPVATVGATVVEIYEELVDAGFDLGLKQLVATLTSRMVYLGSAAGSMTYYWDARSEWYDPVGTLRTTSYVNITGTYQGAVGSAVTNAYQDTWSGYIPVGSVPCAPVRLRLWAVGKVAASFTGCVVNSSCCTLVGIVIPGA